MKRIHIGYFVLNDYNEETWIHMYQNNLVTGGRKILRIEHPTRREFDLGIRAWHPRREIRLFPVRYDSAEIDT